MTETILYDGTVRLRFDGRPGKHSYLAELQIPSVTQITKIIDKSGPLMQWAVNQAVQHIADNLGGYETSQVFMDAKSAFLNASRDAMDVGKEAHSWIESYLQRGGPGTPLPLLPEDDRARNACLSSLCWMDDHGFVPRCTELKLYSRKHRFAGTLDCVAIVDGELCIVDWKTGSHIYPEYALQTAAYQYAYEEMTGGRIENRWIVRIGKDGATEDRCFGRDSYEHHLASFLAAQVLFAGIKEIESTLKTRRDSDVARSMEDCSVDADRVRDTGNLGDHRAEPLPAGR